MFSSLKKKALFLLIHKISTELLLKFSQHLWNPVRAHQLKITKSNVETNIEGNICEILKKCDECTSNKIFSKEMSQN